MLRPTRRQAIPRELSGRSEVEQTNASSGCLRDAFSGRTFPPAGALLVLRYFMPPFDMEAVCPRRSEMAILPILIHRVDSTTTTRGRTVTHARHPCRREELGRLMVPSGQNRSIPYEAKRKGPSVEWSCY